MTAAPKAHIVSTYNPHSHRLVLAPKFTQSISKIVTDRYGQLTFSRLSPSMGRGLQDLK